jgi:ribosomal protein S27E
MKVTLNVYVVWSNPEENQTCDYCNETIYLRAASIIVRCTVAEKHIVPCYRVACLCQSCGMTIGKDKGEAPPF